MGDVGTVSDAGLMAVGDVLGSVEQGRGRDGSYGVLDGHRNGVMDSHRDLFFVDDGLLDGDGNLLFDDHWVGHSDLLSDVDGMRDGHRDVFLDFNRVGDAFFNGVGLRDGDFNRDFDGVGDGPVNSVRDGPVDVDGVRPVDGVGDGPVDWDFDTDFDRVGHVLGDLNGVGLRDGDMDFPLDGDGLDDAFADADLRRRMGYHWNRVGNSDRGRAHSDGRSSLGVGHRGSMSHSHRSSMRHSHRGDRVYLNRSRRSVADRVSLADDSRLTEDLLGQNWS